MANWLTQVIVLCYTNGMKVVVIIGEARYEFDGRLAEMIKRIVEFRHLFFAGTKDVTLKLRGSKVDVWLNGPITE